ncbi:peptidoglycan-binding domain-containing protein [Rhodobacter ferrooxidans]|uniref:Putative lipoprotein n=1 Tax=Rhodobacter ferrooxidans TaxID=371731 RepID=C8S086_9RHOB|nr:peptidoglycan-binding domain-containing protein [Rhodobacter sp. SW2]EEW25695.1 putative lipoprotein [Rhodobacter sp. SW2]
MRRPLTLLCLLALAACQSAATPEAPGRADLAAELTRRSPPPAEDGVCWASDVTPAVIETVTEQVMQPAEPARDGKPARPASFRTVTRQQIVQDREEVWFRTPCDAEMTVDFIATLQRALKARGLYRTTLTGVMDDPTRDAIRRFQAPLGLDSPLLSLAAARDLGIVATDLGQL